MNQSISQVGAFFLKVHDRACNACFAASAWMMLAMAIIIAYEVLVRYFFNSPTIWVVDFTDYIMLYSTFLVSAWLSKHDGHIRLTMVYEYLSPRSRLVSDIINAFIGAIVCGFVIWYGAGDTWDAVEKDILLARPLPVPKYLIIWVIPFGFLLLFVQFLRNGFGSLSELRADSKMKK